MSRLDELNAILLSQVTSDNVEACSKVLSWHPTEASSLVAASATGFRGRVEMRRGASPTALTTHGADDWLIEHPQIRDFPVVAALAGTCGLGDAQSIVAAIACDEIAYEQAKASVFHSPRSEPLQEILASARERGATHITTRRLLEIAQVDSTHEEDFLQRLEKSAIRVAGLWELDTLPPSLRLRPAGRS